MVTNVLWRNDVTISITLSHRIGSNKKQSKQSMNAVNKLLETVFVIAICCLSDYKQQSKILLLTILNTFVDSINVFDCRLSSVFLIY